MPLTSVGEPIAGFALEARTGVTQHPRFSAPLCENKTMKYFLGARRLPSAPAAIPDRRPGRDGGGGWRALPAPHGAVLADQNGTSRFSRSPPRIAAAHFRATRVPHNRRAWLPARPWRRVGNFRAAALRGLLAHSRCGCPTGGGRPRKGGRPPPKVYKSPYTVERAMFLNGEAERGPPPPGRRWRVARRRPFEDAHGWTVSRIDASRHAAWDHCRERFGSGRPELCPQPDCRRAHFPRRRLDGNFPLSSSPSPWRSWLDSAEAVRVPLHHGPLGRVGRRGEGRHPAGHLGAAPSGWPWTARPSSSPPPWPFVGGGRAAFERVGGGGAGAPTHGAAGGADLSRPAARPTSAPPGRPSAAPAHCVAWPVRPHTFFFSFSTAAVGGTAGWHPARQCLGRPAP